MKDRSPERDIDIESARSGLVASDPRPEPPPVEPVRLHIRQLHANPSAPRRGSDPMFLRVTSHERISRHPHPLSAVSVGSGVGGVGTEEAAAPSRRVVRVYLGGRP